MVELSLVQEEYAQSACVALDGVGKPAAWCTRHDQATVEGEAFCEKGALLAMEKRPIPVPAEGVTGAMVEACAKAEYEGTSSSEYCTWGRLPLVAKAKRLEAATRGLNAALGVRR